MTMKALSVAIALLLFIAGYSMGTILQYRQDQRQAIKMVDALSHTFQTVYASNQEVAR